MSKKKVLLPLFGVVALMAFTNPNKNQYLEYSSRELCRRLKDPYKTLCRVGFVAQKNKLREFIEVSTDRKNLLIGSVYTTEIPGVKVHTVGVFGNFLTLP